MRQRMSVARCCCVCEFSRVEGTLYGIDPFDSLDSGWINDRPTYDSWAASGRLTGLNHTPYPGLPDIPELFRTLTPPAALGWRITQEVRVYYTSGSVSSGVFFQHDVPLGPGFAIYWLVAHWGSHYEINNPFTGGATVAIEPADGDLLTLSLEDTREEVGDTQTFRLCCWVNESLIHSDAGGFLVPFSPTIRYGLTFQGAGEFDDFGIDA